MADDEVNAIWRRSDSTQIAPGHSGTTVTGANRVTFMEDESVDFSGHADYPVSHRDTSESQALLSEDANTDAEDTQRQHIEANEPKPIDGKRLFFIRALALLCACSLSVGTH